MVRCFFVATVIDLDALDRMSGRGSDVLVCSGACGFVFMNALAMRAFSDGASAERVADLTGDLFVADASIAVTLSVLGAVLYFLKPGKTCEEAGGPCV